MKACPYCAESIQDAAAKCRFCGEWLDPGRKPGWAEDSEPASGPSTDEKPVWVTPPVSPTPSVRSPGAVRKQTQVWTANVAPAVLEPPPVPVPRETPATEAQLQVEQPRRATAPGRPPVRAPRPDALFRGNGEPAALDDVARRMERIKATAEVVRSALASGAATRSGTSRADAGDIASPLDENTPPIRQGLTRPTTPVHSPAEDELEPPVRPSNPVVHGTIATPATSTSVSGTISSDPTSSAPDALAAQFFGGQDLDGEGDNDAGLSAMESLVARQPPLPWRGILVGAAVVFLVSLVLLFTVFTDDSMTETEVEAQESAGAEATVSSPAAASPLAAHPPSEVTPAVRTNAPASAEATEAGTPSEPEQSAVAVEPAKVSPPNPILTIQVEEARERYKAQDLDAARTILEGVLSKAPDLPAALLLMAQVQLEQENMEEALKTANRCVQLDPTMADCWLTLGVLRQNREENDQAIAAYEKYLVLAPEGTYASDVSTLLKRLR